MVVLDNPTSVEMMLTRDIFPDSTIVIQQDQQITIKRRGLLEQYELESGELLEQVYLKEVVDTFKEDGIRPIAKSPDFLLGNRNQEKSNLEPEKQEPKDTENSKLAVQNSTSESDLANQKTLKIDGERPVDNSSVKVVDTFEADGDRPIVAHPTEIVDTINVDGERPIDSSNLNADQVLKIDGERPVDNSSVEIVDPFEADGERPIMANKYKVVDTLNIDSDRPITSNNK